MANRSRTLSKLWRKFLNGPPVWAVDLPGVKRFSKNGKPYYRTKEWLSGARQRARAMARAKKSHRWRRKIERRRVRAMFSGTGQRKGGMLHELKGVSTFTPVGSLAYDRMVIAAMPIGGWCSAGEIAERVRWPAKPERASKWRRRALHPVGTVLKDVDFRRRSFVERVNNVRAAAQRAQSLISAKLLKRPSAQSANPSLHNSGPR